jgi:hypothetical protein
VLAGSVVVLGEEVGPVGAVSTAVAKSMAASSAALTANLENPIHLELPIDSGTSSASLVRWNSRMSYVRPKNVTFYSH